MADPIPLFYDDVDPGPKPDLKLDLNCTVVCKTHKKSKILKNAMCNFPSNNNLIDKNTGITF